MRKTKYKNLEVNKNQVWSCKVGIVDAEILYSLPGRDELMRNAVALGFAVLFGKTPDFIFSGWNTDLTDGEMEVWKGEKCE